MMRHYRLNLAADRVEGFTRRMIGAIPMFLLVLAISGGYALLYTHAVTGVTPWQK